MLPARRCLPCRKLVLNAVPRLPSSLSFSSLAGVGAVDLISYSSAPFSLHTVTPPRHVMQASRQGAGLGDLPSWHGWGGS